MSTTPEGRIQTAICKELRSRQLFFWRTNNTPTYDPKIGGYRSMGEYALKGVPDILLIKPPYGTLIGLEVKTPTGKISPDQELFKRRMHRHGAEYYVVRSVKELKEVLSTVDLDTCG